MELLAVGVLFLLANGLVLYFALFGVRNHEPINTFKSYSFNKPVSGVCFKEKRLAYQLQSEKRKLRRQLETLEYVSNLESYLNGNLTPANRLTQIAELNTLKLITQKKVLVSAREIISMKDITKNNRLN